MKDEGVRTVCSKFDVIPGTKSSGDLLPKIAESVAFITSGAM